MDNTTVGLTFISLFSPHSASNSSAECYLVQCTDNRYNSCRPSQAPCFRYRTASNITYCAPGSLCSLLEPCDNLTGSCSSNTSVCIVNSCCTPKSVCLPISWTSLCPSAGQIIENLRYEKVLFSV